MSHEKGLAVFPSSHAIDTKNSWLTVCSGFIPSFRICISDSRTSINVETYHAGILGEVDKPHIRIFDCSLVMMFGFVAAGSAVIVLAFALLKSFTVCTPLSKIPGPKSSSFLLGMTPSNQGILFHTHAYKETCSSYFSIPSVKPTLNGRPSMEMLFGLRPSLGQVPYITSTVLLADSMPWWKLGGPASNFRSKSTLKNIQYLSLPFSEATQSSCDLANVNWEGSRMG